MLDGLEDVRLARGVGEELSQLVVNAVVTSRECLIAHRAEKFVLGAQPNEQARDAFEQVRLVLGDGLRHFADFVDALVDATAGVLQDGGDAEKRVLQFIDGAQGSLQILGAEAQTTAIAADHYAEHYDGPHKGEGKEAHGFS